MCQANFKCLKANVQQVKITSFFSCITEFKRNDIEFFNHLNL